MALFVYTPKRIWVLSMKVGDLVKSKVTGPGHGQLGVIIDVPDDDFMRPLLDVHFFDVYGPVLMMPEQLERL